MSTENKSWLARYWKDLLKVISAIVIVFFAVMGWHFSDEANTPFWWNAWTIIALSCLGVWIILWIISWTSQKKKQ